jgi:hypothetical protein
MPDKPAPNQLWVERPRSCSVCGQDFSHVREVDNHIRTCHPDRIGNEEDFFARRDIA